MSLSIRCSRSGRICTLKPLQENNLPILSLFYRGIEVLGHHMSVRQCSAGHVVPKILDGRCVLKFVAQPLSKVSQLDFRIGDSGDLNLCLKESTGFSTKKYRTIEKAITDM